MSHNMPLKIMQQSTSFFHLATIFLIIILQIPSSTHSKDERYAICSSNFFHCGKFESIGYPFWGNNRPEYCGHPGFELDCEEDMTTIQIRSIKYYVINISPDTQILKIARWDFRGIVCPDPNSNTTLDNTLFNYSSANEIATLFYNCSVSYSPVRKKFICSTNNFPQRAFLNITASTELAKELALTCEVGVNKDVQDVLNKGFDITYWIVDEAECEDCAKSGGLCGYNSTTTRFSCFCVNGAYPRSCLDQVALAPENLLAPALNSGNGSFLPKLLTGIGAAIIGLLSIAITICCFRRWVSSKNDQNVEAFIRKHGSLALKRYNYSDIKKITYSLKDKLGQGGFGDVYKGKLLDGRLVAVKVLKVSKANGEEFINEVESISRTSHVNVVSLLGFCSEGHKRALIYEFMPNGSLEKFLYDGSPSVIDNRHLGWEKLYQIAIGIARGLEYLHSGCKTQILHFDIKPHNILLDEDFCPKIADFGLAKLCSRKESIVSMLGARGTIGYIAPEVFNRNFGRVSHKSDVYSYGMMILEMVGGRKNIDVGVSQTSEIYFPHWIYKRLELENEFLLEGVMSEEENEVARKMILVGLWCIQTDPSQRPSISKVIDMLEGSIEAMQIPPKPFLSSPPRSQANSSTSLTTSVL